METVLVDLLERLPELMKRRRAALGLSQAQLARVVGVNQSTIHRIEKGDRMPSSPLLLDILQALRSGLDELVS